MEYDFAPPPPPRRGRLVARLLIVIVLLSGVFAGGILVGRGDIKLFSLSYKPSATELDYSGIDQVYDLLKRDFDGPLDKNKLIEGAKRGLVSASEDPYTEFFNPQEAAEFKESLSGSFTGIGAELGSDDSGHIIVISPLSGYPAEKAGLRPKDIVAAINNEATAGLTVEAAVKQIRGPADSSVTLTIIRGANKPFDVTIKRTKIDVPSVKYQVDVNIGYLKISQFDQNTTKLSLQAASEFKQKSVKAIVLDLRGNPGGYVDSAIDVSSLWLDPGQTVVSERRGNMTVDTIKATGNNSFNDLPTIVLIDQGTASSSEIAAAALRDNKAASLVGEKSFGKGSVQNQKDLSDGSQVKITVAHWYTPAGKNINKEGITPDETVKITDEDITAGRDPQKDKAYQILQSKI